MSENVQVLIAFFLLMTVGTVAIKADRHRFPPAPAAVELGVTLVPFDPRQPAAVCPVVNHWVAWCLRRDLPPTLYRPASLAGLDGR